VLTYVTLEAGGTVRIGDGIRMLLLDVREDRASLGTMAPRGCPVHRAEYRRRQDAERREVATIGQSRPATHLSARLRRYLERHPEGPPC
jgi:sRNA-binding carbon storage regulator CsrA